MKLSKLLCVVMLLVLALAVLPASGQASGNVIEDSFTAFTDAKTAMTIKLMDALSNNPDTIFAAMNLLGIYMVDMVMIPVSFFGLGQSDAAMALSFMGYNNIEYQENQNSYLIKYTDTEGSAVEFLGRYDAAADALACKVTSDGADVFCAEYRKTSFGYVGQYYVVNDDKTVVVYQLSIQGEDGVFGVADGSRFASLTGAETVDFPKGCPEWYAVSGNTVTGVMTGGTQLHFSIAD